MPCPSFSGSGSSKTTGEDTVTNDRAAAQQVGYIPCSSSSSTCISSPALSPHLSTHVGGHVGRLTTFLLVMASFSTTSPPAAVSTLLPAKSQPELHAFTFSRTTTLSSVTWTLNVTGDTLKTTSVACGLCCSRTSLMTL